MPFGFKAAASARKVALWTKADSVTRFDDFESGRRQDGRLDKLAGAPVRRRARVVALHQLVNETGAGCFFERSGQ